MFVCIRVCFSDWIVRDRWLLFSNSRQEESYVYFFPFPWILQFEKIIQFVGSTKSNDLAFGHNLRLEMVHTVFVLFLI